MRRERARKAVERSTREDVSLRGGLCPTSQSKESEVSRSRSIGRDPMDSYATLHVSQNDSAVSLRGGLCPTKQSIENLKSTFRTWKRLAIDFLVAALLAMTTVTTAHANPTGASVVHGDINISSQNKTLTINQATQKGIINWNSFSINADEHTQFVQPGASAITLNRVTGNQASAIQGHLSANGRIILINRNGIMFGDTATVNVGGLIATTADMTNNDFLNDNYRFQQELGYHNRVVNRGMITAGDAGLVALVAPGVENSGIITARLGQVALASGNKFTVDLYGDQLINFAVDGQINTAPVDEQGNPVADAVLNTGTIIADAGVVQLTASVAKDVVQNVVNTSGVIQANSVSQQGGVIILGGGGNGHVKVAGAIKATGTEEAEQQGGYVEITNENHGDVDNTGHRIILVNAEIDVSASGNAGEVRIGGDYLGSGDTPTTSLTYIDSDSIVKANSFNSGNGGRVIVWADNATVMHGVIEAMGGPNGGDGGFIETSGKKYLNVDLGLVNASAPNGARGLWLLDPEDVEIIAGSSTNGAFNAGNPDTWVPTTSTSQIQASTINSRLAAGTDVTILTTGGDNSGTNGHITVTAGGALNASPGAGTPTLTLQTSQAGSDIIFNDSFTFGNVDVVLDPVDQVIMGAGITTTGDIDFQGDVVLTTDVAISGVILDFEGTITGSGGNHDLTVTGNDITFQGNVGASGTALDVLTVNTQGSNAELTLDMNTISTGGNQTYNPTVILRDNVTMTSTSGNIVFNDDVQGELRAAYQTDYQTYDFMDISGTGNNAFFADDSLAENVSVGFDFQFFGTTYNTVEISSNGVVYVGTSGTPSSSFDSDPVSGSPLVGNAIAAWFHDLDFTNGGATYYETQGTVGNRVFIVQYQDAPHYVSSGTDTTGTSTFQVKIFEDSNKIQLHYERIRVDPLASGIHTIMVEDATETAYYQYYSNTFAPTINKDFAIEIETNPIVSITGNNLTVTANSGNVEFNGDVGALGRELEDITVNTSQVTFGGSSLHTEGSANVNITGNVVMPSTAFTYKGEEQGTLAVDITGNITFNNDITLDNVNTFNVDGTVTLAGDIDINAGTRAGNRSTVGTLTFEGTVDSDGVSPRDLTINNLFPTTNALTTVFEGNIGATNPLADFLMLGEVTLGEGGVTTNFILSTTGSITFADKVSLKAHGMQNPLYTLSSSGSGNINFFGKVDSSTAPGEDNKGRLTVNTSGTTNFFGDVVVNGLITDAGGTTNIAATVINTEGSPQTYNDPVTIYQTITFTGDDINFNNTVNAHTDLSSTGTPSETSITYNNFNASSPSGGTEFSYTYAINMSSGVIPIGFAFDFFGVPYEYLTLTEEGVIGFTPDGSYSIPSNSAMPLSGADALIYPWAMNHNSSNGYRDNSISQGVDARYEVTGSAGSRVFTLTITDTTYLDPITAEDAASFQVKLFEVNNTIEVHRGDLGDGVNGGMLNNTVAAGLQDAAGSQFIESYNINNGSSLTSFPSNTAVRYTTPSAAPINVTINKNSSSGTLTVANGFGGTNAFTSITIQDGITPDFGGTIQATGAIDVGNQNVTLNDDTTIIAGSGGLTFEGTINSANATARDLALTATGSSISIPAAIGATNGLDVLTFNSPVTVTMGADFGFTANSITFGDTLDFTFTGGGTQYSVASTTYSFTDISGSGTQIDSSGFPAIYSFSDADNSLSNAVPLNFTFDFFGNSYTDIYVHTDGFITFTNQPVATTGSTADFPTTIGPENLVAGWWEDMNVGLGSGGVYFQQSGGPGTGVLTVQVNAVEHAGGGNASTYQYKFFEATDNIEVHYQTIATDGGATHIAGIENSDGTEGVTLYRGTGTGSITNSSAFLYDETALPASKRTLTLNIGDSGNVTFDGVVGGTTTPEGIVITSTGDVANINVNAAINANSTINFAADSINGADSVARTITAPTITLVGNNDIDDVRVSASTALTVGGSNGGALFGLVQGNTGEAGKDLITLQGGAAGDFYFSNCLIGTAGCTAPPSGQTTSTATSSSSTTPEQTETVRKQVNQTSGAVTITDSSKTSTNTPAPKQVPVTNTSTSPSPATTTTQGLSVNSDGSVEFDVFSAEPLTTTETAATEGSLTEAEDVARQEEEEDIARQAQDLTESNIDQATRNAVLERLHGRSTQLTIKQLPDDSVIIESQKLDRTDTERRILER